MTTMIAGTEPRRLRSYQTEAVDAVEADWAAGIRRVGVSLPTGTGKSTVVGELASRAFDRGQRVLCLAHRDMLVKQMRRDTIAVNPELAPHTGIVMADHEDYEAQIVYATLQTLKSKKRRRLLEAHGEFDVIIWDEVHHAGAKGWHATFSDLGGYHPRAFMCGVTATMHRSMERGNDEIGLGDVMEKISYERDLRWAIDNVYLVAPTGLTVKIPELDMLNDIKTVAGDFHQGELAEAMEAAVSYVVDAIEKHASDRRSIVFAASVAAAHEMAVQISDRGIPAEATTGAMDYATREFIYDRFRSGETRILVTVMVLTEGADFPMCDAVVMARPTKSKNLYTQMIGRALRLFPGKEDALVLDLAGSTRNMKLINLSRLDRGFGIREVNEDDEIVDLTQDEIDEMIGLGEREKRPTREGIVDMVPIDLLKGGQSDVLWLQTPRNVLFIPLARNHQVVFLWPEDGVHGAQRWAVGHITTNNRRGDLVGGHESPVHYDDIEDAIRAAEAHVHELGQDLPIKDQAWRQGNKKPSDGQIDYARSLHIPGFDNMTKGRLSDEISIQLASRVLDSRIEMGL